LILMLSL